MNKQLVAALGCGVIGSSWIESFLANGHPVHAWDPDPRTRELIAQRHRERVTVFDTPQAAVRGAMFIQESGPEVLETKRALLAQIAEGIGERAIVASSTSTLQPTQLQADSPCADRIVIGHPFNPPHIVPLVEVLGGQSTAAWAVEAAMMFYAQLGKHPIRLHRERPGHLANRLQAALWREAIDAVASGQASVADVDAAVTLALGPRWALMGPFTLFHLAGGSGGLSHFLDHLSAPFETLWHDAQTPALTPRLRQQLVDAVVKAIDGRSVQELAAERDVRLRKIFDMTRESQQRDSGD